MFLQAEMQASKQENSCFDRWSENIFFIWMNLNLDEIENIRRKNKIFLLYLKT